MTAVDSRVFFPGVCSTYFIEQEITRATIKEAATTQSSECLFTQKTANSANYSRGSRREETVKTLFLRVSPARISSDVCLRLTPQQSQQTINEKPVTLLLRSIGRDKNITSALMRLTLAKLGQKSIIDAPHVSCISSQQRLNTPPKYVE